MNRALPIMALLLPGCIQAMEPPSPTPMVEVTGGLVFTFGREEPCVEAGTLEKNKPSCTNDEGGPLVLSEPSLLVQLEPFAMDQHEVSNGQYDLCVQMGQCAKPRFGNALDAKQSIYFRDQRFVNYPVVQVPWAEAVAYCEFVGKRLPTQFEWERVARGNPDLGIDRHYPTDAQENDVNGQPLDLRGDAKACAGLDIYTLYCRPEEANGTKSKTTTVVTEPGDDWVEENGQKIYHLYGNVSEYVSDPWEDEQWLTCKTQLADLPMETPGECTLCIGCTTTECANNCKICPACQTDLENVSTPCAVDEDCTHAHQTCMPTGKCDGSLDCHYGCSGQGRSYPVCERYPRESPLSPETLAITGSKRAVRGGSVASGELATCRSRTDYRKIGIDHQNPDDVQPYIGFRCARSL
ncbi:MAG: formylglycine-generating enzyme family protein [Myxococcota bacterium]|nr:formylglycine-generating enzyme family protein [Myxococcota bacterium]